MQIFLIATAGGFTSFAATSLGALLSLAQMQGQRFQKFRLSIDFALGLMISAAAFSLIGPTLLEALADRSQVAPISLAVFIGLTLVLGIRFLHRQAQPEEKSNHGQALLAIVLMAHNFPEGLASGAALVGLGWQGAMPVLASIAVQNIPEGLLMVVCLKAMGWNSSQALLGGIASGLVELAGGMIAGIAMQIVAASLPFLLMVAGTAMLSSVIMELMDSQHAIKRIFSRNFAMGLLSIPLLSALMV